MSIGIALVLVHVAGIGLGFLGGSWLQWKYNLAQLRAQTENRT